MVQITQNTAMLFCVCFFFLSFFEEMETTSKKWKGKFILFWKWLSYREDLQIFWYVSCGSVKRLRGIEKHHAGLRSVSIYSRNNHSLHMLNDMGYRVLMYCSSLKLIIKYATTQEKNYKVLRGKWPKDRSLSILYILATMGSGVKFVWRVLVKYLDPNLKCTANHQICTKQCKTTLYTSRLSLCDHRKKYVRTETFNVFTKLRTMFGKRKSATKLNNKNIKKWEEKTTDSEKKNSSHFWRTAVICKRYV